MGSIMPISQPGWVSSCQSTVMFTKRQWHPTPALLPGKSHGRRSLVGCSPWGLEESDTTERLHFYFSLSCIGEGNGNPLQCSCLENPRDGGAWWAAVYGVAQSWTRLKWLSSSSSRKMEKKWGVMDYWASISLLPREGSSAQWLVTTHTFSTGHWKLAREPLWVSLWPHALWLRTFSLPGPGTPWSSTFYSHLVQFGLIRLLSFLSL